MNDQELLKKLNNLKEIKPDNNWKRNYRDVLYSQISAGQPEVEPKSNIRIIWESIMPRQILINLAKPIRLASAVSVLVLVIGIGGVYASKNSKPGDSLYIAKIISEKAQFAITFDEKDKAKLGIEFAANRAKEMIQVLKDTGQDVTVNSDKLEKLSQSFKKEISQAKNRLSTIKAAIKVTEDQVEALDSELEVFGANLGKDNNRMEISEPVKPEPELNQIIAPKPDKPSPEANAATTTGPVLESQAVTGATSTAGMVNQTDKMLEQVEKLFDEKNLDGTIGALEEVSKVIEDAGEVKGASETATSTK